LRLHGQGGLWVGLQALLKLYCAPKPYTRLPRGDAQLDFDVFGAFPETKNAPEGAFFMVLWRPKRNCINNLLRSRSIVFWWGRGFEL
jgi:hypothetical protein